MPKVCLLGPVSAFHKPNLGDP
eukprot:COSAG01_NODE_25693_length_736_cov_15.598116_1_plen_21_part_01